MRIYILVLLSSLSAEHSACDETAPGKQLWPVLFHIFFLLPNNFFPFVKFKFPDLHIIYQLYIIINITDIYIYIDRYRSHWHMQSFTAADSQQRRLLQIWISCSNIITQLVCTHNVCISWVWRRPPRAPVCVYTGSDLALCGGSK